MSLAGKKLQQETSTPTTNNNIQSHVLPSNNQLPSIEEESPIKREHKGRILHCYCSHSLSSLPTMSEQQQQPPSSLPPSEDQQPHIKQEPPSTQQEQQQQQPPSVPETVPASTAPAAASTSTPTPTPDEPTTAASEPVTVKEEPDAPSAAALDASIEKEDIDMGGTGAVDNTAPQASGTSTATAVDGPAEGPSNAAAVPEVNPVAPAPVPTKKDASLREFLGKMDEYAPIVRPFSLSKMATFTSPSMTSHLTPDLKYKRKKKET